MSNSQIKVARLTIKITESDKLVLEKFAESEGEPVAVVVRRLIRKATKEFIASENNQKEKPQ